MGGRRTHAQHRAVGGGQQGAGPGRRVHRALSPTSSHPSQRPPAFSGGGRAEECSARFRYLAQVMQLEGDRTKTYTWAKF